MRDNAIVLYLDLMEKTLSYTLWPEPLTPIEIDNGQSSLIQRITVSSIVNFIKVVNSIKHKKYHFAYETNYSDTDRLNGIVSSRYGDTLIGLKRLRNIKECIEIVIRDNIEGDLIETGVWRGGACIFMKATLVAYGIKNRKIYVADSFEGLPKPNSKKYPADKENKLYTCVSLKVSKEDVENNFRKYGLLDKNVVFLKGWFKDTLPVAPIDKLAILRLDGDMYESTMDALVNLYPKLSVGGFCIIDDYGAWPECKKAVEDYISQQGIKVEKREIDLAGIYWRKTQ